MKILPLALVVDDDAFNLMVAKKYLEEMEFNVKTA
eukprot:CAMPEP_0114580484 /NCGR_PEP_ID=MMETSP0125-20121206/4760_1 /TAXON_ID=485358 ORGANISM="Aristerostoma sp., Strain ATCC 50986" /NCGR_SAMPLE_ID=MMETSP0125 /ASSEMBLY_ACC=CAM_ASM_000245 /LENGTH=34 /DNA_ID= /DNA_START= /DNA_END= /DNA_ORIENTATION=